MTAKIVHFEGAEGFALLTVPPFFGYTAAAIAGELARNMRQAGVVLIQIGVCLTAAALTSLVIIGISVLALSVSVDTEDEEQ
jgi:hypothetical protein